MCPDGIFLWVLREVPEVIAEQLPIISEKNIENSAGAWTLEDVTPVFKMGKKEDPGNYSPVSPNSISEKVTEQHYRFKNHRVEKSFRD